MENYHKGIDESFELHELVTIFPNSKQAAIQTNLTSFSDNPPFAPG